MCNLPTQMCAMHVKMQITIYDFEDSVNIWKSL